MTMSLRSWRSPTPVSLDDAVEVSASTLHGGVGLLYSPSAMHVARFTPGAWVAASGPINADHVFECRCFTGNVELRWLQDPAAVDATGTAVLLSEDETAAPQGWEPLDDVHAVDTLDQLYLLWGEVRIQRAEVDGFVTLEAARVGRLAVPYDSPPAPGERLALRAREYVCVEPADGPRRFAAGNAYVGEERLLGFTIAPGAERPGETGSSRHGRQ